MKDDREHLVLENNIKMFEASRCECFEKAEHILRFEVPLCKSEEECVTLVKKAWILKVQIDACEEMIRDLKAKREVTHD